MFMFGNFLRALAGLLNFVLVAYMWIIIVRAVISWVNPDPRNPIIRALKQMTDPVLNRVRRVVPVIGGMDISPVVVILALMFLQNFLVPTLIQLADHLQ